MVNMALSQLFWDVLMPWNLKSTYFSLKMIHFLSLNIWYVIYVVFWIKYWNLKLPHHCILFLFTICTVSQLFWNRVCNCIIVLCVPRLMSSVHEMDCLGKETVPVSGRSGAQSSVTSTRRQQFKEGVCRMWGVQSNFASPFAHSG